MNQIDYASVLIFFQLETDDTMELPPPFGRPNRSYHGNMSVKSFRTMPCPSDGNCFFHAFLDQLKLMKFQGVSKMNHSKLRQMCIDNLKTIINDKVPLVILRSALAEAKQSTLKQYINYFSKNHVWVDSIIIFALATIFSVCIRIYGQNGGVTTFNGESNQIVNVAYINKNHYESLHPASCACGRCSNM